jgi:hypothetical protein
MSYLEQRMCSLSLPNGPYHVDLPESSKQQCPPPTHPKAAPTENVQVRYQKTFCWPDHYQFYHSQFYLTTGIPLLPLAK